MAEAREKMAVWYLSVISERQGFIHRKAVFHHRVQRLLEMMSIGSKVYLILALLVLSEALPVPQSYEHNHVRIHVPVYKLTRTHTRTLVKKVPIPVPVPVPIHHKEEHHTFHWPEKSYGSESFLD